MGKDAADFLGKDFGELLAATGLSAEQIEDRRVVYRQAVEERTTLRFDTPSSGSARRAGGLRLSGNGPAGKLHSPAVEWPQHLQAHSGRGRHGVKARNAMRW